MNNAIASIPWPYLETDSKGRVRITDSRIRISLLIQARQAHGWSSEELHFQYPTLSLAQIHSALSYYYTYQKEIDQEIMNEHQQVEQHQAELQALGAYLEAEALRVKLQARTKPS
ncbi:MAG: DUF433 domain-containing protein [Leptolyngbyaceae cyanobacterium SL_5_9]|nr:DUF433 domain-containing protein [Leptolyngbyaceae cyanobacterium SL_5_9]